jgi:hypothetical protein
MLAVGNAKLDRALEMWRDCLASGLWPAYGRDVHVAEPPAWELRWLDNHQEFEEDLAGRWYADFGTSVSASS